MLNKTLILFLIFTGLLQFKSEAMNLSEPFDLSPDYNFSYFQDSLFERDKEKKFFHALLENEELTLLVNYLLGHPDLHKRQLPETEHLKRSINLYLYINNTYIPEEIYCYFCNPLKENNLIKLIYYAHHAKLSPLEIEKIRLLSLAIYARDRFHMIAQAQAAINSGDQVFMNFLSLIGIQKNWIVTYQGRSQNNQPVYNYAVVNPHTLA